MPRLRRRSLLGGSARIVTSPHRMDSRMTSAISSRATDDLVRIGRETMSTSYNPQPIVIERGEGVRVTDREGRTYLYFLAGIEVCGLCNGYPDLMYVLKAVSSR